MKTLGDYISSIERLAYKDRYIFVLDQKCQMLSVYHAGVDISNNQNAIGHIQYRLVDVDNPLKISVVELAVRNHDQELTLLLCNYLQQQGFIFE